MTLPSPPAASHGLLVDDDELYLRTLQRSLARKGLETVTASDIASALLLARQQPPAYALIDLKLGAESGLSLIQPLRALREDMRILLVTGYASIATAVEAIKLGADDYLPKPATVPMILRALGEEDDGPADDGELEPPDAMTPISRLQWEHIQQAMHETGGNVSAAARLLGMHRRSLQRKLAKRPSPHPPNRGGGATRGPPGRSALRMRGVLRVLRQLLLAAFAGLGLTVDGLYPFERGRHRGFHGLFGAHVRAQVGRVVQRALHHEDVLARLGMRALLAQDHVVDAGQPALLGQRQQAGGEPLAGLVEAATVLGVDRGHALADLLVHRMIGMPGLVGRGAAGSGVLVHGAVSLSSSIGPAVPASPGR